MQSNQNSFPYSRVQIVNKVSLLSIGIQIRYITRFAINISKMSVLHDGLTEDFVYMRLLIASNVSRFLRCMPIKNRFKNIKMNKIVVET